MIRELIKAAEGGSLKEVAGELFGRVMGQGSTVAEAQAGARAILKDTAETVALTTHQPSLPGTTSYSANSIAKSDLIAQSVKKVGSDFFAISEYTRLSHADKLSTSAAGAAEHFSMPEVAKLIEASEKKGYSALHIQEEDSGKVLRLSEAGARTYSSSPQMESLLRELSDGIKNNRWSAVIGDDVSGRVPSMLVWDQMQRWGQHRNMTAPQMYFMAGGRAGVGDGFSEEARMHNLAQRMEEEGLNSHSGRAVVVTEIVDSGQSLKQFMRALERHKIPYDVAAMTSYSFDEAKLQTHLHAAKDVKLFTGSGCGRLYAGGAGSGYGLRHSVGVEKYGAEATSRPNLKHPAAVDLFRKELVPLGRYTFEKVFQ